MKRSTKSVYISALVFPGLGHIFLRQYVIGIALCCLAGLSVFFLTAAAIDMASGIINEIESGAIEVDADSIGELVSTRYQESKSSSLPVWVLIISWVIGVVDTYMIGRRQELKEGTSVENSKT